MAASIESRARFDRIRYANCWEDDDLLVEALAPRPGRRCLSIASGGDNSLALLAEGAGVVAVDLSPAQLALVELKATAARRLERPEVLELLGFRGSERRPALFGAVAPSLSGPAASFWRDHARWIEDGVIHRGRFEGFFRAFRRFVLPLVHGRGRVEELLAEKDEPARRAFYHTRWNTRRWRLLFRIFFGRFVMGRLGRDPEFFRYVEGSVADRILARAEYALTVLPTHTNPYLEYILMGNFGRNLPRWLREDVWDRLCANLDALTLRPGGLTAAARDASAPFDGFNLSDVFEYVDETAVRETYEALLAAARPGARIAYWNMLVPRSVPAALAARVDSRDDEASRLFARDRAFFYSAFVLEVVR